MALSFSPEPATMEVPRAYYEAMTRSGIAIPSNPVVAGLTTAPTDWEAGINTIPPEIAHLNTARRLIQAGYTTQAQDHIVSAMNSRLGLTNKIVKLHQRDILSRVGASNPAVQTKSNEKPQNLTEMSAREE